MVMLSWPELVCAPALAAKRQSTQLMSNAFVPPNLKLQFIASKKKQGTVPGSPL
jgi:hypothetical protein